MIILFIGLKMAIKQRSQPDIIHMSYPINAIY